MGVGNSILFLNDVFITHFTNTCSLSHIESQLYKHYRYGPASQVYHFYGRQGMVILFLCYLTEIVTLNGRDILRVYDGMWRLLLARLLYIIECCPWKMFVTFNELIRHIGPQDAYLHYRHKFQQSYACQIDIIFKTIFYQIILHSPKKFSNTWWRNRGSRNYSKTWNAICT